MMRRSYRPPESNHAALVAVPGGLAFTSSFDAGLVAAFKAAIPPESRRWDGANKRWIIDVKYGAHVARLAEVYLGVKIAVPQAVVVAPKEARLLKVEYLGQTKDRGNGESSAFGYSEGGWSVIFPEAILREWFEAVPQRPDEAPTLYAVLAVKTIATPDEVRTAYRRLARQWHPDVCQEPGAAETFKAIHHAYQVLSNELMRRKYDAGLALQASLSNPDRRNGYAGGLYGSLVTNYQANAGQSYGYRAPLRCGYVLAEGTETLGRFVIEKILQWEDVVNDQGQVMVVSWPAGAKEFEVNWR